MNEVGFKRVCRYGFRGMYFFIFLSLLSACAGTASKKQVKPEQASDEVHTVALPDEIVESEAIPDSEYGPMPPPDFVPPQESSPDGHPEAQNQAPRAAKKVCALLGPGMARAVAHVAVLEQLKKSGIQIHGVLGTEMGAVVGALYSYYKANINRIYWDLFKIKRDLYLDFPVISIQSPRAKGEKMHSFFNDIFKDATVETLSASFSAPVVERATGAIEYPTKALIRDVLSASIALPDLFSEWRMANSAYVSGANYQPIPVEQAKSMGCDFNIYVDILGQPSKALAESNADQDRIQRAYTYARNLIKFQKREVDHLIQVDVAALPYDEFSKQAAYISAGNEAAKKNLEEIRRKLNPEIQLQHQ